jgi:hypothetical protein
LGGGGEYVGCQDRESEAEDDLAFHDGVLRGVFVCVGPLLRRAPVRRTSLK